MAGKICQRTVLAIGERCRQHIAMAQRDAEEEETDEESIDELLCAHCQQDFAPDEALDLAPEIPADLVIECDLCDSKHHPGCIEIKDPVLVCKIQNYDWHCSNCKLCSECNKEGDDDKLLFCDLCDRGYHTFCLKPPLASLPEGILNSILIIT